MDAIWLEAIGKLDKVKVAAIQCATIYFVAHDDVAKLGFFNLQQIFLLHGVLLQLYFFNLSIADLSGSGQRVFLQKSIFSRLFPDNPDTKNLIRKTGFSPIAEVKPGAVLWD